MHCEKSFIIISLLLCIIHFSWAFNLSPKPNLRFEKPIKSDKDRKAYFGFSIVLRENSILIGAPRAESTLPTQANVNETGAIYKCQLNTLKACEPFVFESRANIQEERGKGSYRIHVTQKRDYQWLGGSMDGGAKDTEPLVACAPRYVEQINNDDRGDWQGVCYKSDNTLTDKPAPIGGNWIIKDPRQNKYSKSLLGFSSHITSDNQQILMGGPDYGEGHSHLGVVLRYDRAKLEMFKQLGLRSYEYFGYAIATGYLSNSQRTIRHYVATAPQSQDGYGRVYVSNENGNIIQEIKDAQIGNYFGYAILVSDINGDDMDDLIVGAPLQTVNRIAEIGAIFVYVSDSQNHQNEVNFMERVTITAPFATRARFGTTITNLGDINHDGYNDIAVGAPFFGGSGAVAIYFGSVAGLQTKPSQILYAPINTTGFFGHGLSKGVDIDGNGYKDLAIAAPNADIVYVYRTYPVVSLTADFKADSPYIQVETKEVTFTVCYQLDKKAKDTDLSLQLTADPSLKRLTFQNDGKLNVLAAPVRRCSTIKAGVKQIISAIYSPIEAQLSISLKFNGTEQGENFCAHCATMNLKSQRYFSTIIQYDPGCNSKICEVNLSIKFRSLPALLTIGANSTLSVTFDINNSGEKAYNTKVYATTSMNLSLASVEGDCIQTPESIVICDIAKRLSFLQGSDHLELIYDVENVTDAKQLWIHANVTSMGKNINALNYNATGIVQFESHSSFEIVSYPNPVVIAVGKGDESVTVNFMCILKNHGPSIAKNIQVILNIPSAYKSADQKILQLINSTAVVLKSTTDEHFDDIKFDGSKVGGNLTAMYAHLNKIGIFENRTQILSCQNASDTPMTRTQCMTKSFNLPNMKAEAEIRFEFSINFNAEKLNELLKEIEKILAFDFDISLHNANAYPASFLNTTKIITPLAIDYRPEAQSFWYYVIGIIIGVLIMVLAAYGLYKIGFFKRATKEDMQKKILDKEKLKQEQLDTEMVQGSSPEYVD